MRLSCRDVTNHIRRIRLSFGLVTSRQAEAYRTVQSTKLETFSAGQRRVSGESISLTGTLVRLPSRSI